MAANSSSWQMKLPLAVAIWSSIVLLTAILGALRGYTGLKFVHALVDISWHILFR